MSLTRARRGYVGSSRLKYAFVRFRGFLKSYGVILPVQHLTVVGTVVLHRLLSARTARWDRMYVLLLTPVPWRDLYTMLGSDKSSVVRALRELVDSGNFVQSMDAVLGAARGSFVQLALVYVIVRLMRPCTVVELGVASGSSTAFILLGMFHNNYGRLHSIDLPGGDADWVRQVEGSRVGFRSALEVDNSVPAGKDIGWGVPVHLRDRWSLRLGDTKVELKPLLDAIPTVDMALHDSDHSKAAIIQEGSDIWQHLKQGGVLLVDDVDLSDGFDILSTSFPWHYTRVVGRVGLLLK